MSALLPEADHGAIMGLIRDLRAKNYHDGVALVAAVPEWPGAAELTVDSQSVRVVTAPSVLAIRDALSRRGTEDWTVVLCDRPAPEIPAGVLDRLVYPRLLNLDPFPLLRTAFAATQQEFSLLGDSNDLARAVLRDLGPLAPGTFGPLAPLPAPGGLGPLAPLAPLPAPGAVLTNDHVFGELARIHFALAPTDLTPHRVATWSMTPHNAERYASWAAATDPLLVEALLGWLAGELGELGPVITQVWGTRGPGAIVPLGLMAGLVGAAPQPGADPDAARTARTRLEIALGDLIVKANHLEIWNAVATAAVESAPEPEASAVLAVAGTWIPELRAESLVVQSDVLPGALGVRIREFAQTLAAAARAMSDGAGTWDDAAVEEAWRRVTAHRDANPDGPDAPRDVLVGGAAIRLLRRLALPWPQPQTLADWLIAYRMDLSWVDGCIDGVYIGADDPRLAVVANELSERARAIRSRLDREFAQVLGAAGAHAETGHGAPLYIEQVLDQVIPRLTPASGDTSTADFGGVPRSGRQRHPVLLVVADGMSAAAANDIVRDIEAQRHGHWRDYVFADDPDAPLTALAVLPTVTKYSRCSLLTGALASGGQDRERSGFADWLAQRGLRGQGQVLFHKGDLEAVSKGHSLPLDVRLAVQDTEKRPVVACVLNDVDDALDKSDPIGERWGVRSFKRLDALLAEATAVGRSVVLVADHGHVAERREQPSVQRGHQVSARYRAAGEPPAADEVFVAGERVLTDTGQAVLAVDEQLRYTGLKAGYHGGAALAEVTIPVAILVNGALPQRLPLVPSPLRPPRWWDLGQGLRSADEQELRSVATTVRPAVPRVVPVRPVAKPAKRATTDQAALFDLGSGAASASQGDAETAHTGVTDEVGALLAGSLFGAQFKRFGRPALTRLGIGELLREAITSNGVLPVTRVAEIFGLKPTRGRSAVTWLAQIFNIDGVMVIELQGDEVVIAAGLLFEQFGVS